MTCRTTTGSTTLRAVSNQPCDSRAHLEWNTETCEAHNAAQLIRDHSTSSGCSAAGCSGVARPERCEMAKRVTQIAVELMCSSEPMPVVSLLGKRGRCWRRRPGGGAARGGRL